MNKLRGLGIVAGLCLAGAVHAQSQTPPDQPNSMTPPGQPMPDQSPPNPSNPAAPEPDQANPATYPAPPDAGNSNPSSASSPHQRELTSESGSETQPSQSTDPGAASTPHQQQAMRMAAAGGISSGMNVQSHKGKQVGTVATVVNNSSGKPAYVVIADQSGSDTAVPYAAARHMVRGNKIVVDDKRLQAAPKVPESQLQDTSNTAWQSQADSYWAKQGKKSD